MDVLETKQAMLDKSLGWRKDGLRIGFVPTMGALHEGHLELIREARRRADRVVVSIFVNPTQFDRASDLDTYPRTFEADRKSAASAGADAIFLPSPAEVYPEGYQTYVDVEEVTQTLCGATRPGHFRGVATVVLKLFNMVRPDVACFGWKDAQQCILVSRMVEDLNVPVEIVGVEIVREPDGLAMSSRNLNLTPEHRVIAPQLQKGLRALADAAERGERDAATLLQLARSLIEAQPEFRIDYLEMVSRRTLQPIRTLEPGNTLVAVAAFLGDVRLIDNVRL